MAACPLCPYRELTRERRGRAALGRYFPLDVQSHCWYYVNMSLSNLTPIQLDHLLALIDQCRMLGATSWQLHPLTEALTSTESAAPADQFTD